MRHDEIGLNQTEYILIPANGGGSLVQRDQIVGARPNGPDQGAVLYTKAGPSIYTTMTTKELANLLGAYEVANNK